MNKKLFKKIITNEGYTKGIVKYELIKRWGFKKCGCSFYIKMSVFDTEIRIYNFKVICKLTSIGI